MTRDKLISKLNSATQGSRKLDGAIHAELRLYAPMFPIGDPRGADNYTTSLDAAMSLARTADEQYHMLKAARRC